MRATFRAGRHKASVSVRTPGPSLHIRRDISQWKAGTAVLPSTLGAAARLHLKAKVDEGFELSKSRVHRVSGRLADSGRVEEHTDGIDTTFEVIYGGEEYGVDYAGYEEAYHPFLEPSMAEALGRYEDVEETI